MCTDNLTCIHESLFCDGYSQCPDGSDEVEEVCKKCPRTFGFPADKLEFATFPCKHRYTGKFICSIPCDGKDDLCSNNEDENCQEDTVLITVLCSFFLVFVTIISGEIILFKQEDNKKCYGSLNITCLTCLIDLLNLSTRYKHKLRQKEFRIIHDAEDYNTTMTLLVTFLKMQKKSVRRNLARQFLNFETSYHKGQNQSLHLCLKEHLGTNQNASCFFSMTKTNGFVEWIKKKIIKMKLSGILINVSKQSINVEILKLVLLAVLKVIFYYLDLIKDLEVSY